VSVRLVITVPVIDMPNRRPRYLWSTISPSSPLKYSSGTVHIGGDDDRASAEEQGVKMDRAPARDHRLPAPTIVLMMQNVSPT